MQVKRELLTVQGKAPTIEIHSFTRVTVEGLHFSGNSDNSGSNGNINLLLAATAIELYFKATLDDPGLLIWVEGDDFFHHAP